jgi:hypothetical protein
MPSRSGSAVAPPSGVRKHGSVDSGKMGHPTNVPPTDHLEPIQSVQTASDENIVTIGGQMGFTQEQLEEAMKKAGAS